MPRTFGDGVIHMSHLDSMINCNEELGMLKKHNASEAEEMIGKYIAEGLVQDGATLQMGQFQNYQT